MLTTRILLLECCIPIHTNYQLLMITLLFCVYVAFCQPYYKNMMMMMICLMDSSYTHSWLND